MKRNSIAIILALMIVLPAGAATQIRKVNVDLVKGYSAVMESGVQANYYMGRLTYSFLSGGGDSLFVDFVITKQGLPDTALIIEKTGDWGLVKQATAADTLKTIYFRARITNSDAGNYVANLTVSANMTAMWKLADSIVNLMTLQQKLENLYAWTTVFNLTGFGADDITLPDGRVVVGWRSSDGPNGIRFPANGPKSSWHSNFRFRKHRHGFPNGGGARMHVGHGHGREGRRYRRCTS